MYKTILVPLDGSLRAEAILPHVESLALRLHSAVILLYLPGWCSFRSVRRHRIGKII